MMNIKISSNKTEPATPSLNFFIDIYKIHVAVFDNRDSYNEWRRDHGGQELRPHVAANASYFEEFDLCTLYLPPLADLGTIAHECIHTANHILQTRNIQISTDNDEALTYLTELIINKVIEFYGYRTANQRGSKQVPNSTRRDSRRRAKGT